MQNFDKNWKKNKSFIKITAIYIVLYILFVIFYILFVKGILLLPFILGFLGIAISYGIETLMYPIYVKIDDREIFFRNIITITNYHFSKINKIKHSNISNNYGLFLLGEKFPKIVDEDIAKLLQQKLAEYKQKEATHEPKQ